MLNIINTFINNIDYYNHSKDNINIKIYYLDKKEYLTRVCMEYKKTEKRKANKEIRSFLSRTEGITFYYDDDNTAKIFIKKSYQTKNFPKYKDKILFHEISHALNRNRFSEVDPTTDDIFDGLCFIDEFFAYYDSDYCSMKGKEYSKEKKALSINRTLKKITERGFDLHTTASAAGSILAYSADIDELIESEYLALFNDIKSFVDKIKYLITKEKITNEDCENVEYLKEQLFDIWPQY